MSLQANNTIIEDDAPESRTMSLDDLGVNSDVPTVAITLDEVREIIAEDAAKKRETTARRSGRELLANDLIGMDSGELIAKLRKATVGVATAKGDVRTKFNPFDVYRMFYQERYAGIISADSDRSREQQFTAALVWAVKMFWKDAFNTVGAAELKAVSTLMERKEGVPTTAVGLEKRILPTNYALKTYLQKRFGKLR